MHNFLYTLSTPGGAAIVFTFSTHLYRALRPDGAVIEFIVLAVLALLVSLYASPPPPAVR